MCGIAGFLHCADAQAAVDVTRRMARAMRHRGPDDEGYWSDAAVALGFVRLSIVDLDTGGQPMCNEDERVWVVFNGEIYNHRELRRELEAAGHTFHTDHSDTEVLVHGWEQWREGLPAHLNGMFAFAIWDRSERSLFLARDRYGIKPLYTARPASGLLFASEIRAIHASGLVPVRENPDAILEYFSQQNTWGEQTMFDGVLEFPAAHWELHRVGKPARRTRYWDYAFTRRSRLRLAEAAEQHRHVLSRVVQRQMSADVPVMAYLSGGIDSSAITAAAFRLDPGMRAYSCLFDLRGVGEDRTVDEREFSRLVAQSLGIRHVELELGPEVFADGLRETVRSLETLRMGMAYVNFLIAQRVAADGKVVLSGTGGDEIHAGYLYRYQAVSPAAGDRGSWRQRLRRALTAGSQDSREKGLAAYRAMLNFPVKAAAAPDAFTPEFLRGVRQYRADETIARMIDDCPYEDVRDVVLYVDARTYLHGLLVIEDKLSMAHSLESRVPLLDNELVDFVSDLPWDLLCDGLVGKIVFRESVKPWVPASIYTKPKMGFGPPDASWYRSALRSFIEETLSPARVAARGVFQPQFVSRILAEHFEGRVNQLPLIWSLLSFEAWCSSFNVVGGAISAAEAH